MWPLMAKLAEEARNRPDDWSLRGVRVMIMYPMNALVSDQLSRLRRLIGDNDRRFVRIFRKLVGKSLAVLNLECILAGHRILAQKAQPPKTAS